MGLFALAAAICALLGILDVGDAEWLLWWLFFMALHFAFEIPLPLPPVTWRRQQSRG